MSGSRIVYQKDERGVVVDSRVVLDDDETPDGFEDKAEYQTYVPVPGETPEVAESVLTTWDGVVLSSTIDVIKEANDAQEGPSQPGGEDVEYDAKDEVPGTVKSTGDVVTADDGSSEADSGQTVDEIKDEADQQEGPSDPRGEESEKDDEPKQSRSRGRTNK